MGLSELLLEPSFFAIGVVALATTAWPGRVCHRGLAGGSVGGSRALGAVRRRWNIYWFWGMHSGLALV
eukprot:9039280-Pyramimonas_sp.AAC.1